MRSNQIPYATSEEIAEILQLQKKVRRSISQLHDPLQYLILIVTVRNFVHYILMSPEIAKVFGQNVWDFTLLIYKIGMRTLGNVEVVSQAKALLKETAMPVINNFQKNRAISDVDFQILKKNSFCELITDVRVSAFQISMSSPALFQNQKEIIESLNYCRKQWKHNKSLKNLVEKANQIEFFLNDKNKSAEITELEYQFWHHYFVTNSSHMAVVTSLFYAVSVTIIIMIGYLFSTQIKNQFLHYKPLGLLGYILKDCCLHENLLQTNPRMFLKKSDYLLQRKDLALLHKEIDSYLSQIRKYSFYTLLLAALTNYLFAKLKFNEDIVTASHIILVSSLIMAVGSAYPVTLEYIYNRDFTKQTNQRKLLLNQFSRLINQNEWSFKNNKTMANSYYTLFVREAWLNTAFGNSLISSEDIQSALLFSLLKQDFALLAYDDDCIVVSAEQKINAAMQSILVKWFLDYISTLQKKDALEKQLEKLVSGLQPQPSWIEEDISVAKKLPEFAFHIVLKNISATKIYRDLITLLDPELVKIESVDDSNSHITITKLVEINVNDLRRRDAAPQFNLSTETISTPATSQRQRRPAALPEIKIERPLPVTNIKPIINFGKYGVFGAPQNSADIVEIVSPYWPRYTHFGFFAVTKDNFPTTSLFEKFKNIFQKGRLVAPKGQAGIVQNKIPILSANNRWELQNIRKIKDPDEDLRVFALNNVRSNQAVLDIFDTVQAKSHKR